MYFDPLYWLIIGIGMVLGLGAQFRVKRAFSKYSKVRAASGMTGAQIAQRVLADNGISDVRIEHISGELNDHYDPKTKTLRLSEPVYGNNSLAAFGVAAHEAGHAIQHANNYAPLGIRSAWVPVANVGSGLSWVLIMAALFMGGASTALGSNLGLMGVLLFATTTFFTLVTLPVEFDASKRALVALERGGYVSPTELTGARSVLNAAALTYVAAFVTSALTLLYWAFRLGLLGGRSRDE
jgi:Zn-dependent membrane protease YugP